MTEKTKTLLFVLVAVGVLLVAWAAQPRRLEERPPELVGQLLVPADFDPLKAASLEIVKYDEKEARVETFEVAHDKQKGVWSIPSHENYPADAKDHMAEAAITFVGAKILQLVSENPGDHKQYGLLDPDPRDPREGMGTRVIIKDKDNKTMVAVIIGKKVPGQDDLYYVRRVGQDQVFVVSLNPDRLSTRFEDWIEKDLLKLNPWDIKEVEIRDYSVDIVRGIIIQRGQMTLEYNDTGDPRWKLVQDLQATDTGLQQQGLGPDEELNTTKLDDMKFALDDLKIVDVNRKPPGLSADLKAEETLIANREAMENLAARGFYPARIEDRQEIVSNDGEIRVLMKDGVEYLLRFGGPAGAGRTEEKQPSKPEEKTAEQKTTPGMNRFIMVTARFNESAIPKPELQPLPEETSEKTDAQPKSEGKPDANSTEGKTDSQAAPASQTNAESKPEAKSANPSENTSAEKSQPENQEKTEPKKSPEDAKKELEKRREEIQKENERKQKEYQEKLEQGRKKAKELNDRFADWYYIISEETYKKIRLSRSDIVKKKEKKEEEKPKEGAEEQPEEKAEHKHEPGQPEHKQPSEEQPKPSAPGAESVQPAEKSMPGEQQLK